MTDALSHSLDVIDLATGQGGESRQITGNVATSTTGHDAGIRCAGGDVSDADGSPSSAAEAYADAEREAVPA